MVSAPPFLELLTHCPQGPCGEPVDATPCPACGEEFQTCPDCLATNRLRVSYCRGCGRVLESAGWPLHPGLRSGGPARSAIRALGEHRLLTLDVTVVAAPLAAEGVLLVPAHGGGVIMLDAAEAKPTGLIRTPGPIEVTPAVNAGAFFVAAGAELIAFDLMAGSSAAEDARPLWQVVSPSGPVTQPLVAGRRGVYFVTGGGGRGSLHAVSQADGQPLWPRPQSFESELLPPVLLGDHLVVITAAGELAALDPADGRVRASGRVESVQVDAAVFPFAVEDSVLFADRSGHIYKLAVEGERVSGVYLYSLNARASCIAAGGEHIVLGHAAGVTMLDAHGNRRWQNTSSDAVTVPPVLAGGTLLALDDLGNATLYDAAHGNTLERRKIFGGTGCAPPLLVGRTLAAVSSEGQVALIECQ